MSVFIVIYSTFLNFLAFLLAWDPILIDSYLDLENWSTSGPEMDQKLEISEAKKANQVFRQLMSLFLNFAKFFWNFSLNWL